AVGGTQDVARGGAVGGAHHETLCFGSAASGGPGNEFVAVESVAANDARLGMPHKTVGIEGRGDNGEGILPLHAGVAVLDAVADLPRDTRQGVVAPCEDEIGPVHHDPGNPALRPLQHERGTFDSVLHHPDDPTDVVPDPAYDAPFVRLEPLDPAGDEL